MLYRINEIGEQGLSVRVPLSAEWLKTECPDLEARPDAGGLVFKGQLLRQGDDVFLNGSLTGGLECVCSRCLERARLPLRLPIRTAYVPRGEDDDEDADEDEGGAGSGANDDAGVAYFDGDQIDLGPELREQILLAVPISPLCREDCAGLCPVCGGNRNQVPCTCAARGEPAATKLGLALGKLKM